MTRPMLTAAAAILLCACSGTSGQAQNAPVPTAPPNGAGQHPAFPGQTRAPEIKAGVAYQATPVAEGLSYPWGLAFLPDGALLITEKPGRLRILRDGKLSEPVAGTPSVDARAQGGLLGLAIDPAFARTGLIYMSYSEPHEDKSTNTAVARGRLVTDAAGVSRLEGLTTIWRQAPALKSILHYGGRLVFARDGTLFVTTGERSITEGRMQAERLDGTLGKVVRIRPDGSVPRDNPFAGRADARPEIWSSGHRNLQAAALNPHTGALWTIEHGTRGGDELNIPQKGHDYGWPTIAYGIEYAGGPITGGITRKAGLEQPVYYWDPVIAPSGMAFYEARLFPAWKGSLFVGGLGDKRLTRLTLKGDKVVGEERLMGELGERIRDVIVGPDGALYLATDNSNGRVLKITPKP
ncbi:MAG: PQQ-dependent sugar dehydrogenase [Phenylobacterium sp.]